MHPSVTLGKITVVNCYVNYVFLYLVTEGT